MNLSFINDIFGVFFPQAFRQTIEVFQQKNESFKNALKDAEEVSVSVVWKTCLQVLNMSTLTPCHTDSDGFHVLTESRAGEASSPMDPRQRSDHVHEV